MVVALYGCRPDIPSRRFDAVTRSRSAPARRPAPAPEVLPTGGSTAAASAAVAEPPARRRGEDTSRDGLLEALGDAGRTEALATKLAFMARTRFGIRAEDARDLFHESVATYLTIRDRYPEGDNHFGILVGVFHRKALESLDARKRDGRIAQRYVARLQSDRPVVARGEDPEGDVAERVIREEDAALIRRVLATLSGEGRELLLALAEGRATRLELIEQLGINRNTFDTRLRALRLRLKRHLEEAGILV
jgi:DNA-directed RNA polymerase specialized sigma24 family protein